MMVWLWVTAHALGVLGTALLFGPNVLVHSIARSPRRRTLEF
ncbi:MAG: hypothetical protein ACKVQT_11665 [Burkholderiales bacterium]